MSLKVARRMSLEKVELHIEKSGLARITINHYPKKNVLSNDVMESLKEAIHKVETLTGEVKALILYSKYPGFFSAGGDVKEWHSYDKKQSYLKGLEGGKVFKRLEDLPIVTIAAISGVCLGGGNELAMACDYRIATEDAEFGQPEVILGNGLAWGGYYRLVKTIGLPKAKEMILFGQQYPAIKALEIGLINQVVSNWDELIKVSEELAESIVINADTASISKHILNEIGNHLVPSSSLIDAFSAAYFSQTEASDRRKDAFINKRLKEAMQEELEQIQNRQ